MDWQTKLPRNLDYKLQNSSLINNNVAQNDGDDTNSICLVTYVTNLRHANVTQLR